ncbi:aminotransferase class V-fold PLP-dependent enzyme, partial [Alphaproteobacteria bacterium]|nr:aminotransferase class V-fold PLP-dependent enzyme [Alphaproteobacteria bacterium]
NLGVITVWDLSHSVGVLPIYLNKSNIDFAVGCTYKYLNGGPGSPAFIFCSKKYMNENSSIIPGWFSHKKPFEFNKNYFPSKNIDKYLTGTPSIISLAILDSALDIHNKVDINAIRNKSISLSNILIEMINHLPKSFNLNVITPNDSKLRGSHVAIKTDKAKTIIKLLSNNYGITGDYRPPNIIRFGLGPLFSRYSDLYELNKRMFSLLK